MRRQIKDFAGLCAHHLPLTSPIYEFGARQMDGQVGYSDLRPLFPGMTYIGADYVEGPGVDVVIDLRQIHLPDRSIRTAFCLEVLEHVDDVHSAVAELYRVMSDDGILIVSVRMNIRIHGSPHDYWRFTPSGLDHLLQAFKTRFIGHVGRDDYPENIIAVVSKGTLDLATFEAAYDHFRLRWTPWSYRVKTKFLPLARQVLQRFLRDDELGLWMRQRVDPGYPWARQLMRLLLPPLLSRVWRSSGSEKGQG